MKPIKLILDGKPISMDKMDIQLVDKASATYKISVPINDYWQDSLDAMHREEIVKSQKSLSDFLAQQDDYLVDPDLLGLDEFEEE